MKRKFYRSCVAVLLSMVMILVLALGLMSCSGDDAENLQNTDNAQNIPNLTDTGADQRLFLVPTTYSVERLPAEEFGSAVAYGLGTVSEYKVFDDMAKETRVDPFNDQREIVYEKSDCHYLKDDFGEYGSFYSIYDIYKAGNAQYHYLHGTDILCKLFVYGDGGVAVKNIPTNEEEAKKITDDFLDSIYGKGFSSEYELLTIHGENSVDLYNVVYVRVIEGYRTDDTIAVYIDRSGKISAMNAPNVNKYKYLKDRISKEKVDEAKDILMEKLQTYELENLQVVGTGITTDRVGNLYLKLRYSHTVEHSNTPLEELVYISIN